MGSAITIDEGILDPTAEIAIATTAIPRLGPTSIEATSTESTEAPNTKTSEVSQPTGVDKNKQEDDESELRETYTSGNGTTTITTKKKEEDISTTAAIVTPATEVPDLLASGVSFRDPGFVALSVLSGLMLFMMMFV